MLGIQNRRCGGMVDAVDSKSTLGNEVLVRVRSSAIEGATPLFFLYMLVYIHPKCSTCQKAMAFLKAQAVAVTIKDITVTPPSLSELKAMLEFQNGNIKKLLNTSGQLYREMQLASKLPNLSHDDILLLLSQHGMLVKRPFLLAQNVGLIGFSEAQWSAAI